MENYPLWFENKQIGNVTAEKRGLYDYFVCICDMPTDAGFRVYVRCGETVTDLGLCVPDNGSYTLRKQIPHKYIGNGNLRFYIANQKQAESRLIPVCADKPFAGIENLNNAKLVLKDGRHLICFD